MRSSLNGKADFTDQDQFYQLDNTEKEVQALNATPKPSNPQQAPTKVKTKGKKLDLTDFIMLKVIGRGSFGKVYLVQKKDNKQIYALKALKKEDILKRNQVNSAMSEKSIMQQADHEFVAALRYSFQNERNLYLVMDFMPGGELFMHLKRVKKFEEDTVRIYAAEVTLALEYLHTKLDVAYRDLKPENILLDGDGHIKLTDFGLSKSMKLSYSFCGTPEYLAPEILLGQGHSKEVDWWSLGCLIYEMLAGYPAFQNKNRKQLYQDILKNDPLIPTHFSPIARDLLTKLLVSDPNQRLGHNSTSEIKSHPFFAKTDWNELRLKKTPGPIIPDVSTANDLKNFDKNILLEPVADTPMNDIKFLHDPRNYFQNFSYNPENVTGLGDDEKEMLGHK
mmetsp:Transcript_3659/g.4044  ORF Transcript_3659/g.4044 Transcript_3659/m.4044 type:complete len:392 (+) Transcript_3659:1-1176(+)